MQVQSQLAAQYIQDVMQVRLAFIKAGDSLLPCDCSDTRFLLPATVAILQKITDKCFTRCVYKPGARLDDSEKICTAKCMDRYLDRDGSGFAGVGGAREAASADGRRRRVPMMYVPQRYLRAAARADPQEDTLPQRFETTESAHSIHRTFRFARWTSVEDNSGVHARQGRTFCC